MAASRYAILLIGLGEVSSAHRRALEQTPGAEVVAGADIAAGRELRFRGQPVPVYRTPREAAGHHDPGVVVIATPTSTHAAVCAEVAESFPAARILVEKPAADNLAGARQVLADIGSRQPVDIAYHMSFSPEVTWGLQVTRASDLGVPVAARAFFADPCQDRYEAASCSLGNSWIDSGINSLSILARFAQPDSRRSLRRIGQEQRSVFEAHLTCGARGAELEALILTSWHVGEAAKTTRITYSCGAELVMDHTAVAGYLTHDGQIAEVFGSDGAIPRRERHYLALYKWWLTDGKQIMPAQASLRLHELLLQPPSGS